MKKRNRKKLYVFLFLLAVSWIFFPKIKIYSYLDPQVKKLAHLNPKELTIGKKELSEHKVIICGITRDNGRELPHVIKHIKNTAKLFKDYKVIIFENDSTDSTKKILHNWYNDDKKVKIITKNYHIKKRPSIAFLAQARNFYLDEILRNPQYKDFDILMIVDLDMKYGWDIRGVYHSFYHIDKWDAVCSNGIYTIAGHMWDAFAFRSNEFPETPYTNKGYWEEIIPTIQKIYPVGSDFVYVNSCFGGLAFYKKSAIQKCRYESIHEDCEHVHFHNCMKEKYDAKIMMNPSQIIRYRYRLNK